MIRSIFDSEEPAESDEKKKDKRPLSITGAAAKEPSSASEKEAPPAVSAPDSDVIKELQEFDLGSDDSSLESVSEGDILELEKKIETIEEELGDKRSALDSQVSDEILEVPAPPSFDDQRRIITDALNRSLDEAQGKTTSETDRQSKDSVIDETAGSTDNRGFILPNRSDSESESFPVPGNLLNPEFKPESKAEIIRKSGLAGSAGVAFFGSVVFLMIIGWFADLLLGTSPYGAVAGLVLGSIIGFVQLFRLTSQILKGHE